MQMLIVSLGSIPLFLAAAFVSWRVLAALLALSGPLQPVSEALHAGSARRRDQHCYCCCRVPRHAWGGVRADDPLNLAACAAWDRRMLYGGARLASHCIRAPRAHPARLGWWSMLRPEATSRARVVLQVRQAAALQGAGPQAACCRGVLCVHRTASPPWLTVLCCRALYRSVEFYRVPCCALQVVAAVSVAWVVASMWSSSSS